MYENVHECQMNVSLSDMHVYMYTLYLHVQDIIANTTIYQTEHGHMTNYMDNSIWWSADSLVQSWFGFSYQDFQGLH